MQHATLTTEQVRALIARGKLRDTLFQALGIFFLGVGLIVIFLLVGDMVLRGAGRLNLDFFTQFASRRAGSAGILSAWVGSLLVMTVTAFAAVPLGVAAGLYLEEYAKRNWITESSRSTSPTWRPYRPSSMACCRSASSFTPSASARAS
jgi:phosphate transport system permease protein